MADDYPVRLLFDAIEAGRAALRERDDRDIPAKLRTVAASSSRTLPPPLARRLLTELDGDAGLREEAAQQLGEAAGPASALFLRRPAGWDSGYADLLAEHRSQVDEQSGTRDTKRVAELERELKAAKAKARDAVKRAETLEAQAEARVADARRDVKRAGKAAAKRAAAIEQQLARGNSERLEIEAELAAVREELASVRAQREKRSRSPGMDKEAGVAGADPLSLARALDDLFIRVQQHHEPAADPAAANQQLALPGGIAPDRGDAVEWLLGSGLPQVWIVDGHNLAHRLDPTRFTDPRLRVDIADAFAKLRRQALGPLRAEIIFDTGAPVGDTVQASAGVDLRFVADADAEVIALAGAHGPRSVVVSSDGEVRDGASAAGAVVIWSDAVVEFLRS